MRLISGVVLAVGLLAVPGGVQAQPGKGKAKEASVRGKSISEWAKLLSGKEIAARLQAVNALMQAGPEARAAAPALVALFRDADAGLLHPLATAALSRMGGDAVPELEKALGDKQPAVRANAALTLGLLGAAGRPAVPALVSALKDEEANVRQAAAQGLAGIGSAARAGTSALVRLLDDPHRGVRVEAAAALWRIGRDRRGIAVLAEACKGKDRPQITRAAEILSEAGPAGKPAAGALAALLKHEDVSLRLSAAVAHYRVTGEAKAALGVVTAALTEKDPADRRAAVSALGSLAAEGGAVEQLRKVLKARVPEMRREAASALCERGAKLDGARADLEAGLVDPDAGVRWWCALALAAGPGDVRKREEELLWVLRRPLFRPAAGGRGVLEVYLTSRAVLALAEVLRNRPTRFQYEAARGLGKLGLDSRPVQTDLLEALKHDDKLVRRAAAEALAEMGAEVMPTLTRLLGNEDGRVREGAARALGRMGLPARRTAGALVRLVKDPESAVRTQAALALWTVDQQAEVALRVLKLVLTDVDNRDRWEAIEAVGIIGMEARPPIRGLTEVLVNALKDRDAQVRVHAAKWLWRRVKQAKVIVPLLRDSVADRDVLVRLTAAETLGEMGDEDRVVPLLLPALEDRDVSVRLVGAESLARTGAVPALAEALGAKERRVRLGAVRALGLLGQAAKSAEKPLRKLSEGADEELAAAAKRALAELAARPD